MITNVHRSPAALRLAAPIAWRGNQRIARKLLGFAATEQGSALDMFRASELAGEPRLTRLFFQHGLDEARHAQLFRDAAKHLATASTRPFEQVRARRQDLMARFGLVRFVAFVYLSERRAARQFEVLCGYFRDHDQLGPLFRRVSRDEHFHCAYAERLLEEWRAAGRVREVRRALRWVRLWGAWTAWRGAGRRIGDLVVRGLMASLYIAVVPLFALIQRLSRPAPTGWQAPAASGPATMSDLRRPF